MDCIKVTLFVSNRSKYLEMVLRRLLPRNASLDVINVEDSDVAIAHIPITPSIIVASRSFQQTFYGFDVQRVRGMLNEAVKQTLYGTWSTLKWEHAEGSTRGPTSPRSGSRSLEQRGVVRGYRHRVGDEICSHRQLKSGAELDSNSRGEAGRDQGGIPDSA